MFENCNGKQSSRHKTIVGGVIEHSYRYSSEKHSKVLKMHLDFIGGHSTTSFVLEGGGLASLRMTAISGHVFDPSLLRLYLKYAPL